MNSPAGVLVDPRSFYKVILGGDIDAVVKIGCTVVVDGQVDQLVVVCGAGHQNALLRGVLDFAILDANMMRRAMGPRCDFNCVASDVGGIEDESSDNNVSGGWVFKIKYAWGARLWSDGDLMARVSGYNYRGGP